MNKSLSVDMSADANVQGRVLKASFGPNCFDFIGNALLFSASLGRHSRHSDASKYLAFGVIY